MNERATKIRKVVNPISIEIYRTPSRAVRAQVFIEIKYSEDGRLSITGVEGPKTNGDALGACGQIDMHLREEDRKDWIYQEGWNSKMMDRLLEIWNTYHLNDMNAGTPEQTAFINQHKHEFSRLDFYSDACKALRGAGLLVAEHPEQMKWGVGRGYHYGTAWLRIEVPDDVLNWLFSLPASTRTPAWV